MHSSATITESIDWPDSPGYLFLAQQHTHTFNCGLDNIMLINGTQQHQGARGFLSLSVNSTKANYIVYIVVGQPKLIESYKILCLRFLNKQKPLVAFIWHY